MSTGGVTSLADQSVTSRKVDLTVDSVDVTTSETSTSTTYADLPTVGPAITLGPGVTQDHLIIVSAWLSNSVADTAAIASVAIAGAAAADDNFCCREGNANARVMCTRVTRATATSSGATHTAKYRAGGGTMAAQQRRVAGIAA